MTPSVPARRLPPPELPGHTWLRSLGSGGFADVHLYRQEQPAREVAVKVARSVGDQVEYAQIRHEADVMTSIAGHPAVVPERQRRLVEERRQRPVRLEGSARDLPDHQEVIARG